MSADNENAATSKANAVVISKPAAGQTEVVSFDGSQSLAFDFNKDDATFELRDVDLVIRFPDGSMIVLLGFGLKLIEENPTELTFDGQPIDPQMLLSLIGKFVASDVPLQASSTSEAAKTIAQKAGGADAKDSKEAKGEEKKVEIVEVQAEPNNHKSDSDKDESRKSDADANDNTSTAPLITKKMYDEPPSSSSSGSAKPTPTSSSTDSGPGNYDIPVPEISAKLFGIVAQQQSNHSDGLAVRGALALAPADRDESYAVQSAVDTLSAPRATTSSMPTIRPMPVSATPRVRSNSK